MKSHPIYLVQTETTVGFLSQNLEKINATKNRPYNQPCLKTVSTCKVLKTISRIPREFRRYVRNAKGTTFIYPNKEACRLVQDIRHQKFLKKFDWMYSSSANLTKESFNEIYAYEKADIIVEDERGFFEASSSKLVKLGRQRKRRLR